MNKVTVWTTGELVKYIYVWWRKYVLANVGQERQPWSFVLSIGHVQGLFIKIQNHQVQVTGVESV